MRWLVVALGLMLAPAALGQTPADRAAIEGVIRDQMAAFRRDDGAAAFAFAAPAIQAQFGTPAVFMEMVRTGYMAVYRPRSVEFRDLVTIDGQPVQRVLVVGPDGRAELAHYVMERQGDGAWRIAGCFLTRSEDRTT
ncbi:MAG: DUF4864 domain-containing protein [Alphaproteobacteria bacterium]